MVWIDLWTEATAIYNFDNSIFVIWFVQWINVAWSYGCHWWNRNCMLFWSSKVFPLFLVELALFNINFMCSVLLTLFRLIIASSILRLTTSNYLFCIFIALSYGLKLSSLIFCTRNPKSSNQKTCIAYNDLIGPFSIFITVSRIDEMS